MRARAAGSELIGMRWDNSGKNGHYAPIPAANSSAIKN
jgi:hypothetical protein